MRALDASGGLNTAGGEEGLRRRPPFDEKFFLKYLTSPRSRLIVLFSCALVGLLTIEREGDTVPDQKPKCMSI